MTTLAQARDLTMPAIYTALDNAQVPPQWNWNAAVRDDGVFLTDATGERLLVAPGELLEGGDWVRCMHARLDQWIADVRAAREAQ